MTWHAGAALACALYGLLAGQLVPMIIARIPEPEPDEAGDGGLDELDHPDADRPARPVAKELYADIARRRGLRAGSSVAGAVAGAVIGGAVGWTPALGFLLYLVPVGIALAVVDWRTRRLPTKVIAPSYAVVAPLAVVAAWVEADWAKLLGAALGWALAGGLFFAMWFVYPRGMGYGDVRLSGILGIALGYLGVAELVVGVWSGFVLGGVGGLLLALLRRVDRKAYPFGPFMLVGALLGVALGPHVAAWYA